MNNQLQSISLTTRARLCAAAIDYGCFVILIVAYLIVFGKKTSAFNYEVEGNIASLPFVIWAVYFVLFEWLNQGTLGKQIMGLKLSSVSSRKRVSLSQVILRRLCDSFDIWITFGLLALGRIMVNPYGQRIADEVAGTIVEKR